MLKAFKSKLTNAFINSKGYYLGIFPGVVDMNVPSKALKKVQLEPGVGSAFNPNTREAEPGGSL